MQRKLFLAVYIIAFLFHAASGQQRKIHFNSKNNFGLSFGQHDAACLYQTINGLSLNNWFAGIGFGMDNYNYKSFPLFVDVRSYFGKTRHVFGYGDLGYNFSGKNKPGKEIYYTSYHFSGGLFAEAGIGYEFKFIGKSFFTMSAEFTYKEINNKISVVNECFAAPCFVDYSKYKYGNGRVALKAGVDF
jgi:hypothetical protein